VKNIVLIALLTLISNLSFSQGRNPKQDQKQQKREEKQEHIKKLLMQEEEGAIVFQKQTVFGVKLYTDGYGMFLELGRMKTARKSNLFSLEIGERKHPKEDKISSIAGSYLANPYVYGKVNNFYYTKLGYAQQRLIGNKGNKNGVAISAIYGGGLSLGLLKPYYLKVSNQSSNTVKDIKYTGNDTLFLYNPQLIFGSSGFTKGFGEIKMTPGVFVKTALRFDYGRYNELVSALEVGLNVEMYTKKMQQMLLVDQKQLFFNAYAAIEFGRRK
jgi:hypothetical protein